MIKQDIVKILINKTQKSKSTVYRMIDEERKRLLLPNDKEGKIMASYSLASLYVDITKHGLTYYELKTLRTLIGTAPNINKIKTSNKKSVRESKVVIRIDKKTMAMFKLPDTIAKEAKKMSEIYPKLYLLENLLRYVILNILTEAHGKKWWDNSNISKDIKADVTKRMKLETIHRWHGKRGSHPIFYTNFNDLRLIIINNWTCFKELFPDQIWIQSKLKDLEPSRNIIAHNNPLPRKEISRIELTVDDFREQLKIYSIR